MQRFESVFIVLLGLALFIHASIDYRRAATQQQQIEFLTAVVTKLRLDVTTLQASQPPGVALPSGNVLDSQDIQFRLNAAERELREFRERAIKGKDGGIGYFEPLGEVEGAK